MYGVQIGENNYINPDAIIDITRPSLVTIGSNCYFNKGFVLLTHDYVSGVICNVYGEFINSSGRVTIGNNVGTGYNVTILKNVTVGDNCFIAANSLVNKSMPSNVIIGGSPARVLCTLEDYYTKRKYACVEEARDYACSITERFNRLPKLKDFWEEFPLFIDRKNISNLEKDMIVKQLGENFQKWLECHERKFDGFNDFLDFVFTDKGMIHD